MMRVGQTLEPVPFGTHLWPDNAFCELRRLIEKTEARTVPKVPSE